MGYSLGLGFSDEGFGFELIRKEGEEDGFLIQRFHFRLFHFLSPFYQLVRLCHVEDELVADKFGSSIVGVGTLKPDTIRQNGRRHAESREDHGDALDVNRHTENDRVELFAEHADEGWVCGLEVVAKTGFLLFGQTKLTRTGALNEGKSFVIVEELEIFDGTFSEGIESLSNAVHIFIYGYL